MPTKKKRINLTLPKDIAEHIQNIAQHREISQSQAAVDLIELGLDITEKGWRKYSEKLLFDADRDNDGKGVSPDHVLKTLKKISRTKKA